MIWGDCSFISFCVSIYFLFVFVFNLEWLLHLPDFYLFLEELFVPFQFNPEEVKIVEGASSTDGFLVQTSNIITSTNIQDSLSLKQAFSSVAFFKWGLCACQCEPECCICAPQRSVSFILNSPRKWDVTPSTKGYSIISDPPAHLACQGFLNPLQTSPQTAPGEGACFFPLRLWHVGWRWS